MEVLSPAMQLRRPAPSARATRSRSAFRSCAEVLVAVSIVGAIYGVLIAAVVALAHVLFLAHVRGNGVRIGPKQLPAIWERVVRASAKLGLDEAPEVYLVQSNGVCSTPSRRGCVRAPLRDLATARSPDVAGSHRARRARRQARRARLRHRARDRSPRRRSRRAGSSCRRRRSRCSAPRTRVPASTRPTAAATLSRVI